MGNNRELSQISAGNEKDLHSFCAEPNSKEEKTTKEKVEDVIKYLNSHVGLLSLFLTIFIGISTIIIKFFLYIYECGRFYYWGINRSYISVSNENVIYDIFFSVSIFIVICAMNALPYSYITSPDRLFTKIKRMIMLFVTTWISIFIFFSIIEWIINKSVIEWDIRIIIYPIWGSMFLYLTGIILGIMSLRGGKKHKKESNKKSTNQTPIFKNLSRHMAVGIYLVVALSIYSCIFYGIGVFMAQGESTYRMVGDDSVVIYEGNSFFLVCEAQNINNGEKLEANKAVQTEINKTGITTELLRFQEVTFD